jgi:hypothetical protein
MVSRKIGMDGRSQICPIGFRCTILSRPRNEKPYPLIPVGCPAPGATVPRITKKLLPEVLGSGGESRKGKITRWRSGMVNLNREP